jgi:hypothetical protein
MELRSWGAVVKLMLMLMLVPAGHILGMGAADFEAADIAGAAAHHVHYSAEPELLQDLADHSKYELHGSDRGGGGGERHLALLWDARRPPCLEARPDAG